jgi:hypothetical protein
MANHGTAAGATADDGRGLVPASASSRGGGAVLRVTDLLQSGGRGDVEDGRGTGDASISTIAFAGGAAVQQVEGTSAAGPPSDGFDRSGLRDGLRTSGWLLLKCGAHDGRGMRYVQ